MAQDGSANPDPDLGPDPNPDPDQNRNPDSNSGPRGADGEPDPVALGVELLASVERELTVAEAVDRIETVTTNPSTTREILEAAEAEGAVERDGGTVTPTRGTYVAFESQVVRKEGDFECRRCGAGLSEGHFIRFEAGELGPFGSSCIRKVTGRD